MSAGTASPATAQSSEAPSPVRVWLALGAVYIIWGSTYPAIRVMVRTVPALLGGGIRFVLAGVLMLGLLAARGGIARLWVRPRELVGAALVGTLLAAGGNGLVTVAEKQVPAGLAALIVASTPLWIVVLRTLWGDRVAPATLGGVALGFCGVAILLLPGGRPSGVPLGPTLLIVVAALSWGVGSFAAQRWSTGGGGTSRLSVPADPLVSTGWQMLAGGLVLLVAAVADGEPGRFHAGTHTVQWALMLAHLIVVGSLVAFSAYVWLLQNAPISKVSTYAYVNPVVAVFLGWLLLSEGISYATALASAVIVVSVATIVRREAGPTRGPDRRGEPGPAAPPAPHGP